MYTYIIHIPYIQSFSCRIPWTLSHMLILFFFFPKYHPGVLRDHLSSSCRLQADYNRHRHLLFITISSTAPSTSTTSATVLQHSVRNTTLHQWGEKKKHACIFQKWKSRGVEGTSKRSKKLAEGWGWRSLHLKWALIWFIKEAQLEPHFV